MTTTTRPQIADPIGSEPPSHPRGGALPLVALLATIGMIGCGSDESSSPPDGATAQADAGTATPADAGTAPTDAGVVPTDAGVTAPTDAGTPRPTDAGAPTPTDPSGFTVLTPSPDTRTIYVSSSRGSDENDGLSEERAVATVERGKSLLRDGSADWLLFRRRDTWSAPLGRWRISGRSPAERIVVGAYGDGLERPRFLTGTANALFTNGGASSPESMNNLVFVSLALIADRRDPSRPGFGRGSATGISWLRGARDVLVEDCLIQFYRVGMVWQEADGFAIDRVTVRRTLVLDSHGGERPQGMYTDGVTSFVVEECIFDRNGWSPGSDGPTIFDHNMYWATGDRRQLHAERLDPHARREPRDPDALRRSRGGQSLRPQRDQPTDRRRHPSEPGRGGWCGDRQRDPRGGGHAPA